MAIRLSNLDSYSVFDNSTVVFPLSAGKMNTSWRSLSSVIALFCSFDEFCFGGFFCFMVEQTTFKKNSLVYCEMHPSNTIV